MTSFRNVIVRLNLAIFTSALLILGWTAPVSSTQAQEKKAPAQAQTPNQARKSKVDVNSADLKTLETLPGIGPVLAQRIIDGRPYKSLADLGKVKGLNKAKLDAIQEDLILGSAAKPAKAAARQEQPVKSNAAAESKVAPQTPSSFPQQTGLRNDKVAGATSAGRAAGKLAPGEKINLNKATAEELDRLPGIGPAKSKAIVDYRNQNGDFKSIEDVQKVKGIKSGEFSKIKDFIRVTD